ncbi:MAG: hypothetical protein RMA76_09040 [Deltaproteobacteria bacterium]
MHKYSTTTRIFVAAVYAVLIAAPVDAIARPYELYAVYSLTDAKLGKPKQVDVQIDLNAPVVPLHFFGHGKLLRIELRMNQDAAAKRLANTLDAVTIKSVDGSKGAVFLTDQQPVTGKPIPILEQHDFPRLGSRAAQVDVSVHLRYSSEQLCAYELLLRMEANKKAPVVYPAALAGLPMSRVAQAWPLETPHGGFVLASFCPDSTMPRSKWTKIHAALDNSRELLLPATHANGPFPKDLADAAKTPEGLYRVHKRALWDMTQKLKVAGPKDTSKLTPFRGDHFVVIPFEHTLRILPSWNNVVEFMEVTRTEHRRVREVVDQTSKLAIRVPEPLWSFGDSTAADIYYDLVGKHFEYRLATLADNKEVKLKTKPTERFEFLLDVVPKKYLDKQIELRAYGKVGKEQVLVARSQPFTPKNLGFVTTFPVVTELVSAAKDVSPFDEEYESTIPISWAADLKTGDAKYTAVTFPFVVSFNPRSFPDLGYLFSLFAHVSLLARVVDDDSEKASVLLGLGGGVLLFRKISFSVAATRDEDRIKAFLLVGVDIKELVSLGKFGL